MLRQPLGGGHGGHTYIDLYGNSTLAGAGFQSRAGNSINANTLASETINNQRDIEITLDALDTSDNTTPTISGTTTAEPDSTVTMTITDANNNTQTIETTINADGSFSITLTEPLAEGEFTITATVIDSFDNSASTSITGPIALPVSETPPSDTPIEDPIEDTPPEESPPEENLSEETPPEDGSDDGNNDDENNDDGNDGSEGDGSTDPDDGTGGKHADHFNRYPDSITENTGDPADYWPVTIP